MNKEELLSENILLRQQVEKLSNLNSELLKQTSLPSGTQSNQNWLELIGKVWNKTAENFLSEATKILNNAAPSLIAKLNSSEQNLSPEEEREALKIKYAKGLLGQPNEIHAVCEVRERKRNGQHGMAPTIAEAYEIITASKTNTPLQFASDNAEEIQSIELETRLRR